MTITQINKYLLWTNLAFLQSYLLRFNIGPYPTNLQEILILAQVVAFGIMVIKRKTLKEQFQSLKQYRVINSFLLLTFISVLVVPIFDAQYFFRHLKFLLFGSTLTFIFLQTFQAKAAKLRALTIAGYGALAFGLLSVILNLFGFNVAHDVRLIGPLDSAVYLAYYLAPFFIFFTIKYLKHHERNDLVAAIILGLLVIATRSMGAMAGSFIALLVYLFKQHKFSPQQSKKAKAALVAIAAILTITIFYTKIQPALKTDYSSLDERGEIYATSLELLKEPKNLIFGLGYGQFQYHYFHNVEEVLNRLPLDYYVLQPHNIFLLFLFQYGLLGLLLICLIIYKTIRRTDDLENISAFILVYFFMHGLIDTPYFKNDLLILLLLFMEVALAPVLKTHSKPATKSSKTA